MEKTERDAEEILNNAKPLVDLLKENIILKTRVKELEEDIPDPEWCCTNHKKRLVARIKELENENKDLKFKLSCHASDCIGDYEELQQRIKELEDNELRFPTLAEFSNLQEDYERSKTRVKELEEGIRKLGGLLSLDEVEYTTEYWGFTRTPLKREALEELYKLLEGSCEGGEDG